MWYSYFHISEVIQEVNSCFFNTGIIQDNIKVCYLNTWSRCNKFQDLEKIVLMEEYDILGIMESRIDTKSTYFLTEFAILGCNLFNCKRSHKAGGGVLQYIKSSLHPLVIWVHTIEHINVMVYPRVTKDCKEVVSELLVNIFRKSLELGEVPWMCR